MIKKCIFPILVLFISLTSNESTIAQSRFSAGLVAGLTAAQIDGDQSAGFNKVGLSGGLKANTFLTDKMSLGFEILFSQRGSTDELEQGNTGLQQRLQLNYVQVPVIFGYNDWYDEEQDFYHLKFLAGLSYGRLLGFDFEENAWPTAIVENLNENNISWLVGVTYYLNPNLGFSFRYNSFISLLFNTKDFPGTNAQSLRSRYMDLHAVYMF